MKVTGASIYMEAEGISESGIKLEIQIDNEHLLEHFYPIGEIEEKWRDALNSLPASKLLSEGEQVLFPHGLQSVFVKIYTHLNGVDLRIDLEGDVHLHFAFPISKLRSDLAAGKATEEYKIKARAYKNRRREEIQ